MSIATAIKPISRFWRDPEVELPPLEVETPRQELIRLINRAAQDRGHDYVDKSHVPVKGKVTLQTCSIVLEYGCIMGYVMSLKGVSTNNLKSNGLDHYIEEFGWDRSERGLVVSAIQMNDNNYRWGEIAERMNMLVA